MIYRAVLIGLLIAVLLTQSAFPQTGSTTTAHADSDNQAPLTDRERAMLQRIQELEQRLSAVESQLKKPANAEPEAPLTETPAVKEVAATSDVATPVTTNASPPGGQEAKQEEKKRFWGTYTPNLGFKVAKTEHGEANISIYTYARYLNQNALNSTYTNAFGITSPVVRRQDIQLQKVQIKFLGWIMNPKFQYFLYAWTSNPSQGQGAQVVLAGNLNYAFNKHFVFGAGIYSLPGTRSVEGNFPFWLSVDSRLIADEFFRPSYTDGFVLKGQITDKLRYQTMLGNNLSVLGVSALQLDNGLNTSASALVWTPTAGDFGVGFGDFEHHDNVALRLAAHFTRSNETKQSQPSTETFENTQIRLADGSVVFTPDLFGPGIIVNELTYKMAAFDTGMKYRGWSYDLEYFLRWLDNFSGPGTAGLPRLFDQGFQMQASAMVVPKTLQAYAGGSTIHGKFGTPFDFRMGLNFFPFKNKVVRWNTEGLYLNKSPVGYTAVPFTVGGTGWVFHTNLELAF